jgi:NADP-dependent 3-hydroxy acid dehydrogenase YdfG
MTNPVIVVVGAGPGMGAAVARRFGSAGYDVALVARTAEALERLGTQLRAVGITTDWAAVDITDEAALTAAIHRFAERSGSIGVLHFNPSAFRPRTPLELTPEELLDDVRLGVAALLTAVQAARPAMSADGRILVTGSMAADHPSPEAASLGVQKAALRNLVTSLDAALAADGIRAMSLTVNGTLATGTRFAPALVADALFSAAATSAEHWRSEVPYDG